MSKVCFSLFRNLTLADLLTKEYLLTTTPRFTPAKKEKGLVSILTNYRASKIEGLFLPSVNNFTQVAISNSILAPEYSDPECDQHFATLDTDKYRLGT